MYNESDEVSVRRRRCDCDRGLNLASICTDREIGLAGVTPGEAITPRQSDVRALRCCTYTAATA